MSLFAAPYGIREQTKKVSSSGKKEQHYLPPTSTYELSEVFTDLLQLAVHSLVIGGRLVFWLPIYRPE